MFFKTKIKLRYSPRNQNNILYFACHVNTSSFPMIFDPSTPTHIQDIKSSQNLYLCLSLTRISSSLSYSHDYNPTIYAHT